MFYQEMSNFRTTDVFRKYISWIWADLCFRDILVDTPVGLGALSP